MGDSMGDDVEATNLSELQLALSASKLECDQLRAEVAALKAAASESKAATGAGGAGGGAGGGTGVAAGDFRVLALNDGRRRVVRVDRVFLASSVTNLDGTQKQAVTMEQFVAGAAVSRDGPAFKMASVAFDADKDRAGVISEVIAMAKANRDEDVSSLRLMCLILGNLAASSDENKKQVASCGGLEVLVDSLNARSEDPLLQEMGLIAMTSLSYGFAKNALILFKHGALATVLDALATFPDVAGIQQWGCSALARLAGVGNARMDMLQVHLVPARLSDILKRFVARKEANVVTHATLALIHVISRDPKAALGVSLVDRVLKVIDDMNRSSLLPFKIRM
eukprot:g237.t1